MLGCLTPAQPSPAPTEESRDGMSCLLNAHHHGVTLIRVTINQKDLSPCHLPTLRTSDQGLYLYPCRPAHLVTAGFLGAAGAFEWRCIAHVSVGCQDLVSSSGCVVVYVTAGRCGRRVGGRLEIYGMILYSMDSTAQHSTARHHLVGRSWGSIHCVRVASHQRQSPVTSQSADDRVTIAVRTHAAPE